jgi:hypothetical protein
VTVELSCSAGKKNEDAVDHCHSQHFDSKHAKILLHRSLCTFGTALVYQILIQTVQNKKTKAAIGVSEIENTKQNSVSSRMQMCACIARSW